jgi:hypothetical protein
MRTNGEILTEMMGRVVRNGEIPYQANRRAVQEFDIFRDEEAGRRELLVMLEGIDVFVSDLEALGYDFEMVARQVGAAIR